MNKNIKIAMTLAEVMLVFLVIGIVATIISRSINTMTTKTTNKYMTTAAFLNLKNAITEIPKESDGKINATGTTFCTYMANVLNVVGTPNCGATITANDTNISTATPNFITTNGMKFYNFVANPVSAPLYYVVYVDIDGANRKSSMSLDVNTTDIVKFRIYLTGFILPFEKTIAAENTDYLSATAYGIKGSTKTMLKIGTKSIFPYRQAACLTGYATWEPAYCSAAPAQAALTGCPSSATYDSCEVVLSIPKGLRDFK